MDGGHADGEGSLITCSSPRRAGLDSASLKELINENVNSRRLIEQSHTQMQNLLAQLAELSLAAGQSQDSAQFPATALTTSVPATPIRSCVTTTTCTPALSLSSNSIVMFNFIQSVCIGTNCLYT